MHKAILYYILFWGITLFASLLGITAACIMLETKHPFVAGFEDGIAGKPYNNSYNDSVLEALFNGDSLFAILFTLCIMLVVMFWFFRGNFAKLSWGNLKTKGRLKNVIILSLPLLGFKLLVDSIGNVFGIPVIAPDYQARSALGDILLNFITITTISIVLFGAIERVLLDEGKKKWVIFLTILIMNLPFADAVNSLPVQNYIYKAFLVDTVITIYSIWLYDRTRSLNAVIIAGCISYIMPYTFYNSITQWIFAILGLGMLAYSIHQIKVRSL